jgi:lipoic acid synthetase
MSKNASFAEAIFNMLSSLQNRSRLPRWMKMKLPSGEDYSRVRNIVDRYKLHTICTSGNCPNIGECWGRGTATLMILGDICTRSCKFCGVKTGRPEPVDWNEPSRVAQSLQIMKLKHCVLTSVDRDDLADSGAELWSRTIREIKNTCPEMTIEALIPDFGGIEENIQLVINSGSEVISHNLETVKRLTPLVRSVANYEKSLAVLKQIATSGIIAKTGNLRFLKQWMMLWKPVAAFLHLANTWHHQLTISRFKSTWNPRHLRYTGKPD